MARKMTRGKYLTLKPSTFFGRSLGSAYEGTKPLDSSLC